jgi:hypothetical protein
MADFTAPTLPVKFRKDGEFEWATYINDRRPQFKIHRTVGHAHAALTNRLSYRGWGPRRITADVALYHLEEGQWLPQLELASGTMITHFPWQEAPPSPEELHRERSIDQIGSYLRSVISSAERELQGEVRDRVLVELRSARAKVLQIIKES